MQALLHRVVSGKPLGILKYAMTLDGKIATSSGHSAWVTSPAARAKVFDTRARSDAVIVGGQTLRRDNPRLTTRRESGHTPVRILMSRTLDLPPVGFSPCMLIIFCWSVMHASCFVFMVMSAHLGAEFSIEQQ